MGWYHPKIHLDESRFTSEAVLGLESFSHFEVIFYMDQVSTDKIQTGTRHPRNRTDWPRVGIFAQRAKNRANQLGLSRCRLLKVQRLTLTVQSLDAIDGIPVVDIKPYMEEFAAEGPIKQPTWSKEWMRDYYAPFSSKDT
ncbi:TrmO family methyltransferase domain-containing protein [Laceyella putida]|uniref:TrmO family methyltransferase n=1 Tax=Laceyella putida TaxID=110101 RepID=A0ABW2RIF7_9BACL